MEHYSACFANLHCTLILHCCKNKLPHLWQKKSQWKCLLFLSYPTNSKLHQSNKVIHTNKLINLWLLETAWLSGLRRWIWNVEDPDPPCHCYLDLFSVVPSWTPRTRCVNSQLPASHQLGFIIAYIYIWNICLFIYTVTQLAKTFFFYLRTGTRNRKGFGRDVSESYSHTKHFWALE